MADPRQGDAVTETAALNFNASIYGLLGGAAVVAVVAGAAMVKAARGDAD